MIATILGAFRVGDIRKKMRHSNILAWAQENHFLVVEIEGKTMRVTPLSFEPMHVVSSDGSAVPMPITITQQ